MRQWIMMLFLMLLPTWGVAQAQTDTCPATLESALQVASANCDNLDRNSACYGHLSLEAELVEGAQPGSFAAPADRIGLANLRRLRTFPSVDESGVAVMRVQAMLPATLPGQGVLMVVFGDTQMTNDVPADQALTPAAPVTVQVNTAANLRRGPSMAFPVGGSVAAGSELSIDARRGDWLRVVSESEQILWIAGFLVNAPAGSIDTLPDITDRYGAMQAFTITSGLASTGCAELPANLLIQTPQGAPVEMVINGESVTIGSTVVVDVRTPGALQLTVLEGAAAVNGGQQTIPRGFTAALVDDDGDGTGVWTAPVIIDETTLLDLDDLLDDFPDDLLEYAFEMPDVDELDDIEASFFGGDDDDDSDDDDSDDDDSDDDDSDDDDSDDDDSDDDDDDSDDDDSDDDDSDDDDDDDSDDDDSDDDNDSDSDDDDNDDDDDS